MNRPDLASLFQDLVLCYMHEAGQRAARSSDVCQ